VLSLSPLKSRLRFLRYWADAASLLVAGALTVCIAEAEHWLRAGTFSPFSDYWEHAAVLHALIEQPWHPSNPHLLSPASSPRFGPLAVLEALLARRFHLDAPSALRFVAVAYTALFVVGIWLFFRTYFRDARAGLYGLLVMLGSWWEAWTFTSIYQPKVLLSVACYPWVAAFGITLLTLSLALHVLRTRELDWVELGGMVPCVAVVFLTHQITAMMAIGALTLLALTEPNVPLPRRAWLCGTVLAGCLLSAFWPYFSVWGLLAGGQQDAGWVGRGVQAASEAPPVVADLHRFYRVRELLPALGLALLGVVFLPYFFLRWRRLFVGLGVVTMLVPFAVNAFVPLPLGHRFILLAVFFLHVAVVWIFMAMTPGSPEFARWLDRRWLRVPSLLVVWAVLLTFGYHNVQRTRQEWAYFEWYVRRGESPSIRYARRAAEIAGEGAVIVGDTLALWPIPTFGPKVVALQHENPFVSDSGERMQAVDVFLAAGTKGTVRLDLIQKYKITHVLVRGEPRGSLNPFLAAEAQRTRLPSGYSLFTLTPHGS
jgi:hypothetical protein